MNKDLEAVDDSMTPIEHTYMCLLNEFRKAYTSGNVELRERIFQASNVMKELWPDDVARFEAKFGNEKAKD